MRIKFFATGLACLTTLLAPLPSKADWCDTFIRVMGPPLINRGMNYVLSHSRRPPQPYDNEDQYYRSPPRRSSFTGSSPSHRTYRPAAPVVSHTVPPAPKISYSPPRTGKLKLEVPPPPPTTLVPPPPAGVPTGAVLGLYPADMTNAPPPPKDMELISRAEPPKHSPTPEITARPTEDTDTAVPKLAPDFHKKARR